MSEIIKTVTQRKDEAEQLRQKLLRMIVKNEQQRKAPTAK
jgi:hypothetical protein